MASSEPSSLNGPAITFPRSLHSRVSSGVDEQEDDSLATLRQPSLRPPISFRRLSTASVPSAIPRSQVSSVASFDEVVAQGGHEPGASPGSSLSLHRPSIGTRVLSEQGRSSSFSALSPLSPGLPRSPRKQGQKSRRDSRQRESVDEGQQRRALKRLRVVKELLDTEKSYTDGLNLVYEHFLIPLMSSLENSPTRPLVSRDDLNAIFSNFIDIWNLHRAILSSINDAISPAPTQANPPTLASVMLSHFPYLSMYKPFIANFPSALSTLSHLKSTSPLFRAWLSDRERDAKCQNLTLVSWLLTCVQRVPRYLLLLKDLLACSDRAEEESDQLGRVFSMVSKTAETLDRALAEHSLTLSALALQRACVNLPYPLIAPGRRLIKRGSLHREGAKGKEPREFLLFTDCILYFSRQGDDTWLSRPPLERRRSKSGNDAQIRKMGEEGMAESDKWRFVNKLELQDVTVIGGGGEPGSEEARRFEILSPRESFAVYANSAADRQAWLDAIREAKVLFMSSVQSLGRPLNTLTSSTSTRHLRLALQALPAEPERRKVEHFVPAVWVPDQKAVSCMRCGKPWTVLRWRHHCRLCGSVVCADCSNKTFYINNPVSSAINKNRSARACNTCYENVFPLANDSSSDLASDRLQRPVLEHRPSTVTLSSTTSAPRQSTDSTRAGPSTPPSGFRSSSIGPELDNGLPELTPTLLELGVSPFAGALRRTEVQRLEVTARLSMVDAADGDTFGRPRPASAGRAVKRLSFLLGKGDG